jgi:FlgD Ig-like domain
MDWGNHVRRVSRNRLVAAIVATLAATLFASAAMAGPYTRLQVLLPGETAAPGTTSGKTGSPQAQTVGIPFTVTVRACDTQWNTVTTVTNSIQILSTDASATLPSPAQLTNGTRLFTVTLNGSGTFTIFAHDEADNTIPDGTSSSVISIVLQTLDVSSIGKHQTVGVPINVTIRALSPTGQLVSGFNGVVRLTQTTSFGPGRTSPTTITLSGGTWSGGVAVYRADETFISRGNVFLQAELESDPSKNGSSNPFIAHPGSFNRLLIIAPGETHLPGSVTGRTGTPGSQTAGTAFNVTVYSTDAYWNPVGSGDGIRITSTDPQFTPVTSTLSGGSRTLGVTLRTVGNQTLTVNDQSNGSIQSFTTANINMLPAGSTRFVFDNIASPVTAGTGTSVHVRATDASGNTVPNYNGDALLIANTGPGSISPEQITLVNGDWTGNVTFKGAGGQVSVTCTDYSSPPRQGTSNSIVVNPGPFTGLQVLLPGETPNGGTATGNTGAPVNQTAGSLFNVTVRAVDQFWNLVPTVGDHIALASSDAFANMPATAQLVGGQVLVGARLAKSGPQRIWASDTDNTGAAPDTSAPVTIVGGAFARVLILAPGESPAPGTASGRTGTPTDQSINYSFNVTVLATDQWWNPVTGVSDVVHITCSDPNATLPPNEAMVDGRAELPLRLATGGFQQITVSDVTNGSKTGSTTQVRTISSGFHLEASTTPASVRAGETFTLTVKVTNDAGSVIQEINSLVTVEVEHAVTRQPGRGTLSTTQIQLLQGQRSVSETYTFAEPVIMIVRDDAGNAPGITGVLTVTPGPATAVRLSSNPSWVGGNKHATLSGKLVDEFENGISDQPMIFSVLSGLGTITAIDSLTDTSGVARADFLSPRQPERGRVRAASNGFIADIDLETAFMDPTASGGTVASYPNPFHPPTETTTIAYKLDDQATVTIRIYSQSGELVREETFASGSTGGAAGLNGWLWDGRNGKGNVVASGGYVVFIEAAGVGQTQHIMRRKIAVVR